jgi:hypothetical protein
MIDGRSVGRGQTIFVTFGEQITRSIVTTVVDDLWKSETHVYGPVLDSFAINSFRIVASSLL